MDIGDNSKQIINILIAVVLFLLSLLSVLYLCGILYYSNHFFPETHLGEIDVGNKDIKTSEKLIKTYTDNYSLSIIGENLDIKLDSKDIDLLIDSKLLLSATKQEQNPFLWLSSYFSKYSGANQLALSYISYNRDIEPMIKPTIEEYNKSSTQPTNASIIFDSSLDSFTIAKEKFGTTIDLSSLVSSIRDHINRLERTLVIDEETLLSPAIFSENETLQLSKETANNFIDKDIAVSLISDSSVLSRDTLVSFVGSQELEVILDKDSIENWIDTKFKEFNTIGRERVYTRPDGKVVTVSGGTYGVKIDSDRFFEDLSKALTSDEDKENIDLYFNHDISENAILNKEKDWTNKYIDVDLSEQHARFYNENSEIIWESDIVSGNPNHGNSTPTGVYMLNRKTSPETLIGQMRNGKPEYTTRVQYWMPFVGNSVGFHDATWQSSFGGRRYLSNGSHGCVNLPFKAARDLYNLIDLGDVVVVHN